MGLRLWVKMMNNLAKIKDDLNELLIDGQRVAIAWAVRHAPASLGRKLTTELETKFKAINLGDSYQRWYSKALAVIRQLLPDRLDDFSGLYEYHGVRKSLGFSNYRIADALRGYSPVMSDYPEMAKYCLRLFEQQRSILLAAQERLDCSLFEIQQVVQADLFDSEIDAARELNKKGFARAAGAMAGVVLEKHFDTVIMSHALTLTKKNPCINDYNQKLKDENVIDIPTWRFIQRLGDLRNLCDHAKGVDPSREDIDELISGVDRIMKTVS